MRGLIQNICQYVVICVTVFAVVSVGFAHRTGQPAPSGDLAAYLAAGGAIADICGTGDDRQGSIVDCEACRISDTLHLAQRPCVTTVQSTRKTTVLGRVGQRLAETRGLDPARLVRAPPQV